MPLSAGTRLGHYDVTTLLGEGGMGQVWQATDTQLNRQVALKILPDAFASDPDRLARFTREAQILASLNHPNIAAIYGIEEADGTRALVLELVEGPTLADRIAKGPIRLDEALPIARQIAEALEAAHEAGVIHRDLKPANIKVREDGTVKVLDFGLAKAFQPDAGDPGLSQSPTISLTAAATQMGMIIGTAAYMAPEQAKGLTVDKRADIWAYGAVLFEMLTGRKLFDAGDVSEMLASVLVKDPDISSIGSHVPAHIRSVVRQCLVKDPKERLRDIGDVRLAMKGTFETTVNTPATPSVAPKLQVWQRPTAAIAVPLVLVAVTGLAVWSLTPDPALDLARFVLTAPPSEPVRISLGAVDLAISPDGQRVVYTIGTPPQLYVRAIDQLAGSPLAGTEGARNPFFSPDGAWVGFQSLEGRGELKKVSVLGGPSVTLCVLDAELRGASWGADDTIIYGSTRGTGLFRVAAAGGEPEVLTTPEAPERHYWPEILPGGKAVLFTVVTDTAGIALLHLETGEQAPLVPAGSQPRYVATGHIVYGTEGTLRAVPFDLARLSVTGDPVPVVEGVVTKAYGAADFSLAEDGSLVYVSGAAGGLATGTLVWVDRAGREEPIDARPRRYAWVRISPAGTQVAMEVQEASGQVWVYDLTRGTETPLTLGSAGNRWPLWTTDGERIVWRSGSGLVWRAADGTGEVETLVPDGPTPLTPYAWSADGSTLVANTSSPTADILTVAMQGEHSVEPILVTEFGEFRPAVSSDGRWMAHSSNESGHTEIYVRPFPNVNDGRYLISTGGGNSPVWSPDGRELFYRNGDAMMVVSVSADPAFVAGTPEVLFRGAYSGGVQGSAGRVYDIAPDGERFLMIRQGTAEETGTLTDIILVENWFEELKRLVPTN